MRHDCPWEYQVAALARAGRWPEACGPELRAHVAQCVACQEIVAIVALLTDSEGVPEARLPSAGQMWWRLALRARTERERAAARPLVWLHGLAAACGAGLALTALGLIGPVVSGAAAALAVRVGGAVPAVLHVASFGWRVPALLAMAGWVLLAAAAAAAAYVWAADD